MAAGNGHMEAQFLFGFMHDVGEGQIGRDSKKAGKFLLRAALQGHAEALATDGFAHSIRRWSAQEHRKGIYVGGGGHSQRRP